MPVLRGLGTLSDVVTLAVGFHLWVLVCAAPVQAKTLDVDGPGGDYTVLCASNDASRPSKTVGRATWAACQSTANDAQDAKAGDTVSISAGTYYLGAGTCDRFLPLFNPASSGTAPAQITIRGQGIVELRPNTDVEGTKLGKGQRESTTSPRKICLNFAGGS